MDYTLQVREGFSPIRGTSEERFSQGLALELSLTKHLSVSALSSWRRIDGAVSSETLEASAISENSLHREEQSLSRKWQVPLNHYGLQCALTYKRFRLSVQSLYTDFGKYYVAHPPPRSGASLQLRNLNRFIVQASRRSSIRLIMVCKLPANSLVLFREQQPLAYALLFILSRVN